jgi:altronate hydrolase
LQATTREPFRRWKGYNFETRRILLTNNALIINTFDNVAIAIHNIKKGDRLVIEGKQLFNAAEDIDAGHKIALRPIQPEEKVFRYGEAIVRATRPIGLGEWVHVHNTEPIPGEVTV